MHMFDASSMIYGWDNYPLAQFPKLWGWFGDQISAQSIQICETAHNEVCGKVPDCGNWLKQQQITVVVNNPNILQEAASIKALLQIAGNDYHADGVGENDLLIIASARIAGGILVSDEKKQLILPNDLRRYKIPAVCAYLNAPVPCQNFLEYIKSSGQTF